MRLISCNGMEKNSFIHVHNPGCSTFIPCRCGFAVGHFPSPSCLLSCANLARGSCDSLHDQDDPVELFQHRSFDAILGHFSPSGLLSLCSGYRRFSSSHISIVYPGLKNHFICPHLNIFRWLPPLNYDMTKFDNDYPEEIRNAFFSEMHNRFRKQVYCGSKKWEMGLTQGAFIDMGVLDMVHAYKYFECSNYKYVFGKFLVDMHYRYCSIGGYIFCPDANFSYYEREFKHFMTKGLLMFPLCDYTYANTLLSYFGRICDGEVLSFLQTHPLEISPIVDGYRIKCIGSALELDFSCSRPQFAIVALLFLLTGQKLRDRQKFDMVDYHAFVLHDTTHDLKSHPKYQPIDTSDKVDEPYRIPLLDLVPYQYKVMTIHQCQLMDMLFDPKTFAEIEDYVVDTYSSYEYKNPDKESKAERKKKKRDKILRRQIALERAEKLISESRAIQDPDYFSFLFNSAKEAVAKASIAEQKLTERTRLLWKLYWKDCPIFNSIDE